MHKLPSNWTTEHERLNTRETNAWTLHVQQGADRAEREARLAQVPSSLRRGVTLALVSTYRIKLLSLRPRGLWDSQAETVFEQVPTPVQPLVREAIEREKKSRQSRRSGTSAAPARSS